MLRTGISYILYHVGDTIYDLADQRDITDRIYRLYNWCLATSADLDPEFKVWEHPAKYTEGRVYCSDSGAMTANSQSDFNCAEGMGMKIWSRHFRRHTNS